MRDSNPVIEGERIIIPIDVVKLMFNVANGIEEENGVCFIPTT